MKSAIIRPTYLLREDICRGNIRMMAHKAIRAGVGFRPHFKTHQSRLIGNWFREEGVSRITVSSLRMAHYFQQDGWDDITVAFPVNRLEIGLIDEVTTRIRLGLLVEDADTVSFLRRNLKSEVDVYLKIDSGYHRTGLEPEDLPLKRQIIESLDHCPRLTFKGLLTHAGRTYQATGPKEIRQIGWESMELMVKTGLETGKSRNGYLLSVGDTPSCSLLDDFPGMDEIRPGNFVFYDLMQIGLGVCTASSVAALMVCPVVAVHPRRNQAVIYGGAVHFSKEILIRENKPVYGQMALFGKEEWGVPVADAYLAGLSQEHGILEAPPGIIRSLKPGQLVGFLPVHACLTANLMKGYYLTTNQVVDHLSGR